MKNLSLLLSFVLFLSASSICSAQVKYSVVKTFHIESGGGWDYIAVGPDNNRLYVSHATQVNVLDEETGDSIGVIPNTTGVHGIAFDPNGNGYTSNGKLNNVTIFDIKTNEIKGQVATGLNPDAIMYETFTKTIITCNGHAKSLSLIDPASRTVVATIEVGGKPETAVADGKGTLFVNLEDKSQIAVVDLNTKKLIKTWSVAPGEAPTGLAYDNTTNRLFAGCGDNKMLIVLDASSGKIVAKLPIGDGCDGVAFDQKSKRIFAANGDGTMTVIQEKSADSYTVLANVPTARGARTITINPATQTLFLPTADFLAPDPANAKAKPKMKPGTFKVLVVREAK